MYHFIGTTLLLAATSLAIPVPNPQLGVTLSTPIGGLAIGTPSVTNPQPRPYYGYGSSSYYPPNNYPGIAVYPGALTSAIGEIASDVTYGIGDSIARGTGARPGYSGSDYAWRNGGYPYNGYNNGYGYSNYGRGWNKDVKEDVKDGAAHAPEGRSSPKAAEQSAAIPPVAAKPVEEKPAAVSPAAAQN